MRAVVAGFVDRFFADDIIGYLFQGRDRERIIQHELELASRHLGGDLSYTGRGISQVHQPLRISSGHFRRRLALLRQALLRHDVPVDVVDAWVAHDARLESVITDGTDCVPPASTPDRF